MPSLLYIIFVCVKLQIGGDIIEDRLEKSKIEIKENVYLKAQVYRRGAGRCC